MRIKKADSVCVSVRVFVLKLLLIGVALAAHRPPHESATAVVFKFFFSSALSLLFKSSAHHTSLFVWSQIYLPTSATGHRLQIDFQLEAEGRVFTPHAHFGSSDFFSTGSDELPAC